MVTLYFIVHCFFVCFFFRFSRRCPPARQPDVPVLPDCNPSIIGSQCRHHNYMIVKFSYVTLYYVSSILEDAHLLGSPTYQFFLIAILAFCGVGVFMAVSVTIIYYVSLYGHIILCSLYFRRCPFARQPDVPILPDCNPSILWCRSIYGSQCHHHILCFSIWSHYIMFSIF